MDQTKSCQYQVCVMLSMELLAVERRTRVIAVAAYSIQVYSCMLSWCYISRMVRGLAS